MKYRQPLWPRYVKCSACGWDSKRSRTDDGTFGRCLKCTAPMVVVDERRQLREAEIARHLRGER